MSVVERKAERRIAPGGESRGRVEENRAKVCGTTKATDGNEKNEYGFTDRMKKRRTQTNHNLARENEGTPIKRADKQDKVRGKHAEKQRKTAG